MGFRFIQGDCRLAFADVMCLKKNRSVAFQIRALPFGSVRSVHAFLRVARSLWAIATSEFMVPSTSYFDDFVTFSDSNEQVSVDGSARFMLKSLGWRFAESGDKAPRSTGLALWVYAVCGVWGGWVGSLRW